MTNRRSLLRAAAAALTVSPVAAQEQPESDRAYSLRVLARLADPVLTNAARGTLKRDMPVEAAAGTQADRRKYTHLEALGRLLAGIAPWLESQLPPGPESDARQRFAQLAREALHHATDPKSPDFLNFNQGSQPVVDCGFLAQAILRAPNELWKKLDPATQHNLVAALVSSRVITPGYNNWLLFSAIVEAALGIMGEQSDHMRIDFAIRKHQEWYLGDGHYGDGPQFHWDYYNSFVIQPMLLDVLRNTTRWNALLPDALKRARRYAAIQERLIAPDGSYPAIGRSITYRCGAFHLLAQMALLEGLPVRSALTAVIRKTIEPAGTFDSDGWLQIGLAGHQPHLGENYISTGSLYLAATALLPLGLPPAHDYWTAPPKACTSAQLWSGQDAPPDHAL